MNLCVRNRPAFSSRKYLLFHSFSSASLEIVLQVLQVESSERERKICPSNSNLRWTHKLYLCTRFLLKLFLVAYSRENEQVLSAEYD